MKKLLLAFSLLAGAAGIARAANNPIYGVVQITTSTTMTPPLQSGAFNVSSGTVQNFTTAASTSTTFNASVSSITTITAQNFTAVTSTSTRFNASVSSITSLAVNSVTSSPNFNANKLQNIANGSASSDGAAFGQIGLYSLLCSSVTTATASTTGSTFIASTLGCSAALTNSAHHILILGNGYLSGAGATSGNAYTAGVFVDGANMDAATYGSCAVDTTVAGLSLTDTNCNFLEYYAPGDTASHAYRVFISAASASGTAQLGQGQTMRFFVFEVL